MSGLVIPEIDVINDNTGQLVTVINSDTSATTINNSKVQGLVNIGTHAFSAYPLVPGTDVLHDALANLTDVSITSPANTDILQYNGSKWVNQLPPFSDIVASAVSTELTTTSATNIVTYTPSTTGIFNVQAYFTIITAATTVLITLSWTDPNSSTIVTFNWYAASGGVGLLTNTGSYSLADMTINAKSGAAITVSATAGTANQVYVSAVIVTQ